MKEETKKELETAFAKTKERFSLTKNFEEYDDIFFLYDMVSQDGFVAEKFERQLANRIINTFTSWYNHLHSIIIPNSGHMVSMTESSMFDDKEKEQLNLLMNTIVLHISRNTVLALTKDTKEQRAFLDDSVDFWHRIHPQLLIMAKKVHQGWDMYASQEITPQKKE